MTAERPAELVGLADGHVDLGRQLVERGGHAVPLTTREVELLAYLASRPGEAVSREELHTRVWGYATAVVSRTVDTTVRRLRTKIEVDPSQPTHLQTVHGRGYRFQPAIPPDGLVGRTVELARVERALLGSGKPGAGPLVGVLGGPGVGKTRLLREVAERWRGLGRPVVWCDAAGAADATALALRVAVAARVSLADGDAVARVARLIEGRGGLFVLDGVAPTALEAVERWRRAARGGGAVLFSCGARGLVPAAYVELGPLDPSDAARLFVARASAVDAAFSAPPETVARIVEHLDHLPLAIELAAARMIVMSAETLLARLEAGEGLLGTLGGTLQRSLAAAIGELPADQRAALAQCALFRRAFALEDAEAVVAGVPSVIDALQGLRDRSLLALAEPRGAPALRFVVPHTVRAALELDGPGPDADGVRRRHVAHLVARSRELRARIDGPDAGRALAELRELRADLEGADADDVDVWLALDLLLEIDGPPEERVAALERRAATAPEIAVRYADALRVVGRAAEAREVAKAAAALPPGPVRARARVALAVLGVEGAGELARHSLVEDHPDPPTAVRLWSALALDAKRRGDGVEADHALRRALEVVHAAGIVRYEAAVTSNLANLRRAAGQLGEAERLYRQASAAAHALGEGRIEAAALHNLGAVRAEQGALDEGIAHLRRALDVARHGGELAVRAHVAHTLGHLLHRAGWEHPQGREGCFAEAELVYLEAIGLLREIDPGFACSAEGDLAALVADRGMPEEARRLLRDVAAGLPDDPVARAVLEIHLAHVDAALARTDAPADAEALRAAGRARVAQGRAAGGERCRSVARLAELALGER